MPVRATLGFTGRSPTTASLPRTSALESWLQMQQKCLPRPGLFSRKCPPALPQFQHCRIFRGIRNDWHYTCFCLGMLLVLHFANIDSRLVRFTYISCTSYILCTPSYSSAAYLKTQTGSMLPHSFLLQCRLVRAH